MANLDDARRVLRDVFGFRGFRRGQKRVISTLLDGDSALAVFPTGGGKSLCYQLPALLLDGLTVVVSPLIALMKDQVDFLVEQGIAAARLDSSLNPAEARQVYADLRDDRLKILYIAPERLASERFLHAISDQRISLLAVDEAHCISEWGHNFRPEYLKIARLAERLEVERVLALTATATPRVARDIAQVFNIAEDHIVITGYHRANLELHVTPCRPEDRFDLLCERLDARPPGPTIVYVTLQRTAEEVAQRLVDEGFDAVAYHAGLKETRRHEIQDEFMASESQIIVATIAFGMGIDKSDIRAVYHYNLPKGPENYAQEIGRAGRDGQTAHCELFASADDVITLENFTYGDTPGAEAIASFLEDVLGQHREFAVSVHQLATDHDIRKPVVGTLLTYLELEGVLESTGPFYAEYRIRPLQPVRTIVERPAAGSRNLLRRIFDQAHRGSAWYTLDLDGTAEALNLERSQIAGILADLESDGLVELKAAQVRQGYRRRQDRPSIRRLTDALSQRFQVAEEREINRVRLMLEFSEHDGCLTRNLLEYFGDELEDDCGHCGRCLGEAPAVVPRPAVRTLGRAERELVACLQSERRPELATPRQLARFLCGLCSPATSNCGLNQNERFGALADVPFADVLRFVEAQRAPARSIESRSGPVAGGRRRARQSD